MNDGFINQFTFLLKFFNACLGTSASRLPAAFGGNECAPNENEKALSLSLLEENESSTITSNVFQSCREQSEWEVVTPKARMFISRLTFLFNI